MAPQRTPPRLISAPCGAECACAVPLNGIYDDWIWCERRGTTVMVAQPGRECGNFSLRSKATAVNAQTSPRPRA
jgi:hypothetical protein